jgi:phosphoribosylanthranilate isomerase
MSKDQRTRVKICGLTNLDDARCAARAGADFLGFILYPKSPRFLPPPQIAVITRAIRREFGAGVPRCVGVFVNEPASQVQSWLDAAELDLVQLHGHESPEEVQRLHPRAFKAIRPQTGDDAQSSFTAYRDTFPGDLALPQLLLDAYHPERFGGTGLQVDLAVAQPVAAQCRLLLAGGLTPDTVGAAIEAVRPWGVDVSSGVERTAGTKDHARIETFIRAARGGT